MRWPRRTLPRRRQHHPATAVDGARTWLAPACRRQRRPQDRHRPRAEIWESQGEKSPHSAAHYGVYAFKPTGWLAFFGPGTEAYTGVTVWLEAHKQNQFLYRPASDGNTLQRFGELTAAAVLQLLLPLLIILLGFSTFAGERESGTLRQVLSLGVDRHDLALGLLLVPAVLLGAAALTAAEADSASGGLVRTSSNFARRRFRWLRSEAIERLLLRS